MEKAEILLTTGQWELQEHSRSQVMSFKNGWQRTVSNSRDELDREESMSNLSLRNPHSRRLSQSQVKTAGGSFSNIFDLYSTGKTRSIADGLPHLNPLESPIASIAQPQPVAPGKRFNVSSQSMMEMGHSQPSLHQSSPNLARTVEEIGARMDQHQYSANVLATSRMAEDPFHPTSATMSTDELPPSSAFADDRKAKSQKKPSPSFAAPNFFSRLPSFPPFSGRYPSWLKNNARLLAITVILLVFLLAGLLAFFLWPRRFDAKIVRVISPADQTYALSYLDDAITVNVTSLIQADVYNPNYVRAAIRAASIKTFWNLKGAGTSFAPQQSILFGTGNLTEPIGLPSRSHALVQFPVSIQYTGKVQSDALYLDFLSRCLSPNVNNRVIYLVHEVDALVSLLGQTRQKVTRIAQPVPCPLQPDQIREVLHAINQKVPLNM